MECFQTINKNYTMPNIYKYIYIHFPLSVFSLLVAFKMFVKRIKLQLLSLLTSLRKHHIVLVRFWAASMCYILLRGCSQWCMRPMHLPLPTSDVWFSPRCMHSIKLWSLSVANVRTPTRRHCTREMNKTFQWRALSYCWIDTHYYFVQHCLLNATNFLLICCCRVAPCNRMSKGKVVRQNSRVRARNAYDSTTMREIMARPRRHTSVER